MKNKLISVFLILSMVCSLFSVVAFANTQSSPADIIINKIDGNVVTITALEDTEATIVLAAYKGFLLKTAKSVSETITAGMAEYTIEGFDKENCDTVRAFVLKDIYSAIPLAASSDGTEAGVKKFNAKVEDNSEIYNDSEYLLGYFFEDSQVAEIITDSVTVSVTSSENDEIAGVYTKDSADWTKGIINFGKDFVGTAKITIQDNKLCVPTTICLNVVARQPKEKFDLVFENTDKYMYRVGNVGTVELGKLFKALDGAEEIVGSDVTVTVTALDENINASGTYTKKATDWTKGTIQFTGTGVVKVAIDDNNYCVPKELLLEVVDAKNITAVEDATGNNVVLLNNATGGFKVSNSYAFYGNGFKVTCAGDGSYGSAALNLGFVTVSNGGILDNVQIICDTFPTSALYTNEVSPNSNNRYPYVFNAIVVSGDSTISNCYVYGARSNIYVSAGNVKISNTITECGSLANIQIKSSDDYTVTLDNLTTIQYQTTSKYDTSKSVLGFGVVVGDNESVSNAKLKLTGDLKQYNWVNEADKEAVSNSYARLAIGGALNETKYKHTINGKTTVNMGITYLNSKTASIDDQRSNSNIPYELSSITMSGQTGQVYSIKSNSGITAENGFNATTDGISAGSAAMNAFYIPQFKLLTDLGGQFIKKTDDGDEYCYIENGIVKVMFEQGTTRELDLNKMITVAKYSGQDLNLVITCKDVDGNAVAVTNGKITLSEQKNYTVTYSVTDRVFYDKDGNALTNMSNAHSWEVPLSVTLKDKSLPNAEFVFDTSKQVMGSKKGGNGITGYTYTHFIKFLSGLQIYDYNLAGERYLRFDGNTDFAKIASVELGAIDTNKKTTVTIKLVDGGVLIVNLPIRGASGSSATTASIKTANSALYLVNGGTTSAETPVSWTIDKYTFIGNNGVEVSKSAVTFTNCSETSTPSGTFGTTVKATVIFDANGGNCIQSTAYATSAATSVTLPTPKLAGHIFDGWYTAASGGTKVGDAGASYTPSGNITLYAQWSAPSTVIYNANGGNCATSSAYYDGTALILPNATRENYVHSGWYTASSGGTLVGVAGASYRPRGNITLYAQWAEIKEVVVTYNANGGSCSETSKTATAGDSVTLPTPTRTGYTFNGWYTAASGGTKIGDAGASYRLTDNITLYAQWTQIKYTITVAVSDSGGSWNGPAEAVYGASVSGTITYSGSRNKSWKVVGASSGTQHASGTGTSCSFNMPAENVTLTIASGCLAEGTMITMADGSQKAVEKVAVGDEVLTWNFMEGKYEAVPVSLAIDDGKADYTVITLDFEDKTSLRIIDLHGIFDADLNRYVYITPDNAKNFIGHTFVKLNADGTTEKVKLDSYEITIENIGCYTIQTAFNINCVAEGMLTQTPPLCEGYFDYFEFGDYMKYDTEKMQADIEKYGLYTYEDFKDYLTYDAFMAFNGPYLKVAVGKGYLTYDYLIEQIKAFGIGISR